jgi:ABC-2 type transport system ATP-binding protein
MGLVVSIREVSKTYGKKQVPAVDSLNLEIREGEIFGFIGPNGAGKTTTIKMLTGILPPDKGSIVIDWCGSGQESC